MTTPPIAAPPSAAPITHEEWVATARAVAAALAEDAVARDRANRPPFDEAHRLREAGLLTLLIPAELGGGGADWRTAYAVIREIAAGDGSIGQLIGYHYLLSWNVRFFGDSTCITPLVSCVCSSVRYWLS